MNQILTIIWLKYKMFAHGLHRTERIVDLVIRIFFYFMFASASLAIAFGFGVIIYIMSQSIDKTALLITYYIAFYACFFIGVITPLIFQASSPAFEPSRFLLFPLSHKKLYGFSLFATFFDPVHLFYYPTLLTILLMRAFHYKLPLLSDLVIIICMILFYVIWGNTLVLILQSVLKKRKSKELLMLISMLILIAFSFLP